MANSRRVDEVAKPRLSISQSWRLVGLVFVTFICAGLIYGLASVSLSRSIGHIGIVALVSLAWAILGGGGGRLSFGHAAFFGIGALVTIVLMRESGLPLIVIVLMAVVAAQAVSTVVLPVFRTHGAYFAIATLALAEGLRIGIERLVPDSIPGLRVPYAELPPAPAHSAAVVVAVGLTVALISGLRRTSWWNALSSVRSSAANAEALGVSPLRQLGGALMISSALTGLAGSLFAIQVGVVASGDVFGILWSIEPALAAILGGLDGLIGPVVGAVVLGGGELLFRELGIAGGITLIVQGAVLLIVVAAFGRGLVDLLRRPGRNGESTQHNRSGNAVLPAGDMERVERRESSGRLVLATAGLSKHFEGLTAVDNVSIDLRAGRITGLIGPNGAGKSTFMKLAAGFLAPDGGRVTLNNEDVSNRAAWERSRKGMLMVRQHDQLFDDLTLSEAIRLARCYGPSDVPTGRAEAQSASFGDIRLGMLTASQRAYAAILVAAASGRDAILLDEVFAGLSQTERSAALSLIKEMRRMGRAVMVVDHLLDVVFDLCDEIYVLNGGRVIAHGVPREIAQNPVVIDAYLGTSFDHHALSERTDPAL